MLNAIGKIWKNAAMLPTKISDDLAYKCKCFTGVAQGE